MIPATNPIDSLIHSPARLRTMATLVEIGPESAITFSRLRKLLGLTAGNLLIHLRKLEAANYLELDKRFEARPNQSTFIKITAEGSAAFQNYVEALRRILTSPQSDASSANSTDSLTKGAI